MPTLVELIASLIVYLDENPLGAVDTVNVDFTLSQSPLPSTTQIFVNGVHQIPDIDYSISDQSITFFTPPFAGSEVSARYIVAGFNPSNLIWNENLGTGDTSTTTFSTANTPISNSNTEVYVNGVYQIINVDYAITEAMDGITFTIPPFSGSTIYINYRYTLPA